MIKDEEVIKSASAYFGALAKKSATKESVKALLMEFLFDKFIKTRNSSVNAVQRLSFLRQISHTLHSLKNRELIE